MTNSFLHSKACAWLIAVAIIVSSGSVLAVDQYVSTFESSSYDRWGAESGTVSLVTLPSAAQEGTDLMYVAQDADATNGTAVAGSTTSNVWVDMWLAPNLWDGVATNREYPVASGAAAVFFFDENGYVVVNQGSGSTNWTVISNDLSGTAISVEDVDVATNLQRVTVYMNYANDQWALFLNGSLIREDLPFNVTRDQLEKITLSDDVYADMITVSATNYPGADSWPQDSGILASDEDADGLLDAYELHYFGGVESHYAGTDTDGDGRTDGEEFLDGTDPTDAADASWVIPYFEKFAAVATAPTTVTDSYRALTNLAGTVEVNDTYLSAMGDQRGIDLTSGGISIVVTNAGATNVFCQAYVVPVAAGSDTLSADLVTDEAAAIGFTTNASGDGIMHVWDDTGWVPVATNALFADGSTWIGLAAHLVYAGDSTPGTWDLYYSASNQFVTAMSKVPGGPFTFNSGYTGSGKFEHMVITNDSPVAAHVDAIAVSLSYEPTYDSYTNLVVFERKAGEAKQVISLPPYAYGTTQILTGAYAMTELGEDLALSLFPGDEIYHGQDRFVLDSNHDWTTTDEPDPINPADGLLLTRQAGSDTLVFYPYSNVVAAAWSNESSVAGMTDTSAYGRSSKVFPSTFPGGCIDINDKRSLGFDGPVTGTVTPGVNAANQWDEIIFYDQASGARITFTYIGTAPSGNWSYATGGSYEVAVYEVCPGDAFTYYNYQDGTITWKLVN